MHDRTGPNGECALADGHQAPPGDDVVDLGLGVRLLPVDRAGWQDVEPDR
jgi:hypothetical protein